jgi:hypothetical protein
MRDRLVRVRVPAETVCSASQVDRLALRAGADAEDEALAESLGLPVEFVRAALAITMAIKSGMAVLVEPPNKSAH